MRWIVVAIASVLLILLLLSIGQRYENPSVRKEPPWDRSITRALAVRSCYDCHSNETVWPWYASIPPVSWWLQREVREGREALNLSEWDRPQKKAGEAAEEVAEGEMPPRLYTLMHPSAKLSLVERRVLILGFRATLGSKKGSDD